MNELHFAVVSGINRYLELADLRGPRNDAEAFCQWLVDPDGGGVPVENVVVVRSSSDDDDVDWDTVRPGTDHFNRAFSEVNQRVRSAVRAAPEARRDTRLYVFLAGHGMAPVDEGCAVLMPIAAPGRAMSHVEIYLLANWYHRNRPFREVVLLADCCRESIAVRPSPPALEDEPFPGDAVSVAIGTATEVHELAWEPAETTDEPVLGHFTRALLDGLRHAVDPSGRITTARLDDHVQRLVNASSNGGQSASVRMLAGRPIVLRSTPLGATYTVRLHFPEGAKGVVALEDLHATVLDRFDVADGTVLELRLASGVYRLAPEGFRLPCEPDCLFRVEGRDRDVRC